MNSIVRVQDQITQANLILQLSQLECLQMANNSHSN